MKNSYLTVTDQFCGLGGNTEGVKRASANLKIGNGIEVVLAMNHWPLAIRSHNTNHPNAEHVCANVSDSDPRCYRSTDIYIGSPECTKHTHADGTEKPKKQLDLYKQRILNPEDERSRATMWDVPRFAECHKYNYLIVENVLGILTWVLFDVWLKAMHKLGYRHKIIFHNSQFSWPTPQSRDRVFVHFWKKGNKAPNLEFTPLAYCPNCSKDVHAIQSWKDSRKKYGVYGITRGQYVYRCPIDGTVLQPYHYAAFNAIDWSDLGEPILQRKRGDLSPNTLRRAQIGLDKFYDVPFMVNLSHSKADNVKHVGHPLYTQTTCDSMGFITPLIVENNSTGTARPSIEPLATITTSEGRHALLWPFMVENKGQSTARDSRAQLATITNVVHHGIVSHDSFKSFLSYYNGGSDVNSYITKPAGAFTGNDRVALHTYRKPSLEECFYRSLKPGEVKIGMGFDPSYVVLGNSKEQVKQCGNAVPPSTMQWQIERAIQTFN